MYHFSANFVWCENNFFRVSSVLCTLKYGGLEINPVAVANHCFDSLALSTTFLCQSSFCTATFCRFTLVIMPLFYNLISQFDPDQQPAMRPETVPSCVLCHWKVSSVLSSLSGVL